MIKINIQKNKGFTLIELMVASSIFAMIMLVCIGALIVTLNTAKNSRALRVAMDNVNFAMESMTRSLRMGTSYYCAEAGSQVPMRDNKEENQDCENGGTFIAFVPQLPDEHFSRIGYQIVKRENEDTHTLKRCDGSTQPATCVDIVSSDVDIHKLNFIVKGSDETDGVQASVYMMVQGSIMIKGKANDFSIQTLASQRNF